jgi:hypothetical protein
MQIRLDEKSGQLKPAIRLLQQRDIQAKTGGK